jgi:antirestriction protein ArdC
VNFTLLSLEAQARGFGVNRLTYRHAQERGGQVRKGERGTIVFWQLRKIGVVAEEREDDPPAPAEKIYPLLRAYTVFNVAQIDGLDAFADGAGYYAVACTSSRTVPGIRAAASAT